MFFFRRSLTSQSGKFFITRFNGEELFDPCPNLKVTAKILAKSYVRMERKGLEKPKPYPTLCPVITRETTLLDLGILKNQDRLFIVRHIPTDLLKLSKKSRKLPLLHLFI